jgi:hypothetical protein
MKKHFGFYKTNALFLLTLGLLAFIPLYPKLPLLDVRNTWVYIRLEDFVVLVVLFLWGISVMRRRNALETPLTIPILLFWAIGAVATIHGLLLIFASLGDVRGNVALFSFIRRIEYMSVFFVAYSAMRDKRFLSWIIVTLVVTVLAVTLYGIGQKYAGFPAFLTMNEEFAKGTPIRLSGMSRVSSTFAGHYDLAAYLVLVLPILTSMVFAVKNRIGQIVLGVSALLGFVVMMMTVSRISLVALVLAVSAVVFVQKRKFVLLSAFAIILGAFFIGLWRPSIVERYTSTVRQIDVLVSAKTGEAVGHSVNVSKKYFADKSVRQVYSTTVNDLYRHASPAASLVIPYDRIEDDPVLFVEPNAPNGENLPQGTGYINLGLSPVARKLGHFYFQPVVKTATTSAEVFVINGDFLIKRVFTYDLSFTTRFQGEWPRAIETFRRNIFIGSGYGSVGLAVDNSYLRMLAEVGLLGIAAYFSLFIISAIYAWRVLPGINDQKTRSFVIGFTAGVGGLLVNAVFIDVFETSKVAFVLWLLFGVMLGTLTLYRRQPFDLVKPLRTLFASPVAIILYLLVMTLVLFPAVARNNFVGDDFTWLRWAADCGKNISDGTRCNLNWQTIVSYFTQAQGFFYRPGAKLYFLLMYSLFWLNQSVYHHAALLLHFGVSVLVFFLARKVLRNFAGAVLTAVVFLLLSGHAEPVFWVSATGFLFASFFSLASVLWYISWIETGRRFSLLLTVVCFALSLLFHELGVVTPLFYFLYSWSFSGLGWIRGWFTRWRGGVLLLPLLIYSIARYAADSHWLSGDYNYNLLKLPFNGIGNGLGYVLLGLLGPLSMPFLTILRMAAKTHIWAMTIVSIFAGLAVAKAWKRYRDRIPVEDRAIWLFGSGFFFIALLPFIGLGTITSRYSYLSSVAVAVIIAFFLVKTYRHFFVVGKATAVLVVIVIGSSWSLLQLIQHQKLQDDWQSAGEVSGKLIVAVDAAFENYWRIEPMEFHFVNVPIRQGDAWVFPVGLPDLLWLVLRNPSIRVFMWPTLEQAFEAVSYESKNQKVFEFTPEEKLVERKKIRITP